MRPLVENSSQYNYKCVLVFADRLFPSQFVDKAPAAVVSDARKRFGEAEEQIRQLQARLEELDAIEAKMVA